MSTATPTPIFRSVLFVSSLIFVLSQPALAQTTESTEIRKWSDLTGKFSVDAKLISNDGETVILERETGQQVQVPLNKLSKEDQAFLKNQTEHENPFTPIKTTDHSALGLRRYCQSRFERSVDVRVAWVCA